MNGKCAKVNMLAAIFLVAAHFSLVDSESCDSGVLKLDKVCVAQCLLNTTCACTAETGSDFEHCEEFCMASKCPDMKCTGGKTCRQYCGQARCSMTCVANEESCVQNCTAPGKCDTLKCSSKSCTQSCANCTMICTKEVQSCRQVCRGGQCDLNCMARNCRHECSSEKNGTPCEVDKTGNFNGKGNLPTDSFLSLFICLIVSFCLYLVS